MSQDLELPEEVKIFLLEAYENLDKVEQDLVLLESDPSNQDLLNSIFRSVHTIKGNSGFLGFSKLESLCHKAESLLDKLRNNIIVISADITSALLESVDIIRQILTRIETTNSEGEPDIQAVERKLAALH